jgi:hypothetical protein
MSANERRRMRSVARAAVCVISEQLGSDSGAAGLHVAQGRISDEHGVAAAVQATA